MQQEEGWVVCRAFKKPSPSHKQSGFESWNNTCYDRSESSRYRPPSYPSIRRPSTIIHNFDLLNNHGTTSNLMNQSHSAYEHQMLELPKLDSPSISTSFTTNDNNFEQSGVADNDQIQDSTDQDDKSNKFGNELYSEWKSFDKLFESQVMGTSSSYAYPNMALVPHNDDGLLDGDQNHLNNLVLECFPDL
ncbi:NAC domain-containing protein 30 [Sesamum alatum]|uniref:NAC domain-containing protein 30 n=1 Tax=Sesamum alatum TaxID=300844 RepID=A0AAE2CT83_9LAMI|nr:NAC domain-containing protein 30 [Sesamum alatum]